MLCKTQSTAHEVNSSGFENSLIGDLEPLSHPLLRIQLGLIGDLLVLLRDFDHGTRLWVPWCTGIIDSLVDELKLRKRVPIDRAGGVLVV
jgi:hypothetical protein